MKDMDHLSKKLMNGIATAKGVDGDFLYITVGEAKKIVQMINEREPKAVYDMKINGHRVYGFCPNCTYRLDNDVRVGRFRYTTNFCPSCGQSVKWE